MSDAAEVKPLARMTLMAWAERAYGRGLSALEWEESVADTPEGRILGTKEIAAIGSIVFVRKR